MGDASGFILDLVGEMVPVIESFFCGGWRRVLVVIGSVEGSCLDGCWGVEFSGERIWEEIVWRVDEGMNCV